MSTKSHPSKMNSSLMGNLLAKVYPHAPLRRHLLTAVVRAEGGQLYSLTLRRILREHHGVEAGDFSYGSLLEPGMSDTGTVIGSYVSIGPNVRRFGAAHPMGSLSLHPFWYNPRLGFVQAEHDVQRSRCVIGNDVWVGANVTILPGCESIGDGAVVGAGAVVTRSVAPFTIVAGNPAKPIGERLTAEERLALFERQPWRFPPQEASKVLESIRRVKPAQ